MASVRPETERVDSQLPGRSKKALLSLWSGAARSGIGPSTEAALWPGTTFCLHPEPLGPCAALHGGKDSWATMHIWVYDQMAASGSTISLIAA
jgi:hypothetical protein